MGIAMILIGIFHSSLLIDDVPVLNFIKFSGDIGVDIFFFVSGFGMYYSFLKEQSLRDFYMKRFARIIPLWFGINLVVQIYNILITGFNLRWFVLNMTGLSFFLTGSLYYWYIPAILFFYLITPYFVKLFKNVGAVRSYVVMGILTMLLTGICIIFHNAHFFIMIFRIPVYFAGYGFGWAACNKKIIDKSYMKFVYILFFVSLIPELLIMKYNGHIALFRYDFKYIAFFITSISGCLILCRLFNYFEQKSGHGFITKALEYVGQTTLSIYLLHEFVLARCTFIVGKLSIPIDNFMVNLIINIIVFVAVVFIAHIIEGAKGRKREI